MFSKTTNNIAMKTQLNKTLDSRILEILGFMFFKPSATRLEPKTQKENYTHGVWV